MDEAWINKDTRNNYSWLERGRSRNINNIKFKNSINWISAITANGLSINLFKYTRTTQKDILQFLKFTFKYLTTKWGIDPEEVGIILDNWACHRAKSVVEYWEELGANLLFIPPYWPELAPVEVYFSKLKKEFIKTSGTQFCNLASEAWIKGLKKCIYGTEQAFIKRLWLSLLNKVHGSLDNHYHLDLI